MGQLVFQATLGGQVNLVGPNTASTFNLNVPAVSSTLATLAAQTFSGTQTMTTLTSPAATNFTLQSAGTTAITVDTSQNVGIGTSSPAQKLHVAGTGDTRLQVESTSSGAGVIYLNGSTAGFAGYNTIQSRNGSTVQWAIGGSGDQNTLPFYTNGSERMRIDSSGNVGIGTSSPAYALHVQRGAGVASYIGTAGNNNDLTTAGLIFGQDTSGLSRIFQFGANPMTFWTNGSERARIDSSGNLLVNQSSGSGRAGKIIVDGVVNSTAGMDMLQNASTTQTQIYFRNTNGVVGQISTNGSLTTYSVSSDYRLKENIVPMTGALAKVAQLKPVTYKWKVDGSDGEGFIAHELAEVKPDCVSGDKDAVDADGNPKYQGIDTSFLVATLTAAIQELKAINDTQAETINALTARVVALEAK